MISEKTIPETIGTKDDGTIRRLQELMEEFPAATYESIVRIAVSFLGAEYVAEIRDEPVEDFDKQVLRHLSLRHRKLILEIAERVANYEVEQWYRSSQKGMHGTH